MPLSPHPAAAPRTADGRAVAAAVEVLSGRTRKTGLARILPFLGPAFVACVAYIDPGNFATNLEGGAKFGYTLVWVVVASNLMAMLIQSLSAKLGIATGRNLAEMCRETYPRWLTWFMWVLMEGVAMATDLAEFLGAALGFYLLFGMPLWVAGFVTALATFLILGLERYGFRWLEAVITSMVGIVAVCYVAELGLARPDWGQVALHAVVPQFRGTQSVLLATGILGATVMPHVIFLHSALTQGRIVTRDPAQMIRLFWYEVIDVIIAMGVAGLINAAMLVMAAKTFHEAGLIHVDAIEKAYMTLQEVLGTWAM
jgi:manganese transport protein